MYKDIVLLLIGGGITFIFAFVLNRLSRRKARLTWRILPPVHLPSQELAAFNLIIANRGTEVAKNVRVVIELPYETKIDSLEIQPSEAALRYSLSTREDQQNKIDVEFPSFQSSVDCVFSFLARKSDVNEIKVSITAEQNIVGEADKDISREAINRIRKTFLFTYLGMIGVTALITIFFAIWTLSLANSRREYLHQADIGDFYYASGQYQKALELYTKIPDKWYMLYSSGLRYRMARVYAQLNNKSNAINCLIEISKTGDVELAIFALTDPSFNTIRNTKEFNEFAKKIKIP